MEARSKGKTKNIIIDFCYYSNILKKNSDWASNQCDFVKTLFTLYLGTNCTFFDDLEPNTIKKYMNEKSPNPLNPDIIRKILNIETDGSSLASEIDGLSNTYKSKISKAFKFPNNSQLGKNCVLLLKSLLEATLNDDNDDIAPDISGGEVIISQQTKVFKLDEENPINTYLQQTKNKYNKIKSLLYKGTNFPFYELYVCNSIDIAIKNIINNKQVIQYERHDNVGIKEISMLRDRNLIIKGTGGIGKTMFMQHILLDTIDNYSQYEIIPVFVNIRDYQGGQRNLEKIIENSITINSKDFFKEDYEILRENGKILYLFDGLDEVDLKKKNDFDYELRTFMGNNSQNIFIMTSREIGTLNQYDEFLVSEIVPLRLEQSIELIKKLHYKADEQPELEVNFINLVTNDLQKRQRDFLENPLLLTIMYMIYDKYLRVPDKLFKFYENAYSVLSKEHDASKGKEREYKTKLNSDEIEQFFSEFCARSYLKSNFDFDYATIKDFISKTKIAKEHRFTTDDMLYDLISGLCLLYEESNKYFFMHRSFQEYFAALFFSKVLDSDYEALMADFDRSLRRYNSDNVLPMLYDMKENTIEQAMFYPYLKRKFELWNNDYKKFLIAEYEDLYFGDYDGIDDYHNLTKSPFLNFIISKKKIPKRTHFYDFDEDELFLEERYVQYKLEPYDDGDEDNNEIGPESDIPDNYDYDRWPTEDMGCECRVSFEEIFDNYEDYTYEEYYNKLMDDDFSLKKQFNALLNYYKELEVIHNRNLTKTSFFND